MIKFVSLRGNKTHLYAITSRNSNNPLLSCRAFHPRTSRSTANTIYRASHRLCEVERDSQLYKREERLADSPTVVSLQRWGWMPEDLELFVPRLVCREALSWCRGSYLVATDSPAAWQGTWKLAWRKKSTSSWPDAGGKCWLASLCCREPEEETSFPAAAVNELQSVHWVRCVSVHFTEALQWKRTIYSTFDGWRLDCPAAMLWTIYLWWMSTQLVQRSNEGMHVRGQEQGWLLKYFVCKRTCQVISSKQGWGWLVDLYLEGSDALRKVEDTSYWTVTVIFFLPTRQCVSSPLQQVGRFMLRTVKTLLYLPVKKIKN